MVLNQHSTPDMIGKVLDRGLIFDTHEHWKAPHASLFASGGLWGLLHYLEPELARCWPDGPVGFQDCRALAPELDLQAAAALCDAFLAVEEAEHAAVEGSRYCQSLREAVRILYQQPLQQASDFINLQDAIADYPVNAATFRGVMEKAGIARAIVLEPIDPAMKDLLRPAWFADFCIRPEPVINQLRAMARQGKAAWPIWQKHLDNRFDEHLAQGMAALKLALPYWRDLAISNPDPETARLALTRLVGYRNSPSHPEWYRLPASGVLEDWLAFENQAPGTSLYPFLAVNGFPTSAGDHLSPAQKASMRILQDASLHHLASRCATAGIPMQIHTGQAFSGGMVQPMPAWSANPAWLQPFLQANSQVSIILLHGGFPFENEYRAVLRRCPSTLADLSRLPVLNPAAARRQLSCLLQEIGSERIMGFGGDDQVPHNTLGHWQLARQALIDVLYERASQENWPLAEIRHHAGNMLWHNPIRIFGA